MQLVGLSKEAARSVFRAHESFTGWAAIHRAAMCEDPQQAASVVDILLSTGADAEAMGASWPCTPLMLAAQQGNLAVCTLLMRRGSGVRSLESPRPEEAPGPLHMAARGGYADIVQVGAALMLHVGC